MKCFCFIILFSCINFFSYAQVKIIYTIEVDSSQINSEGKYVNVHIKTGRTEGLNFSEADSIENLSPFSCRVRFRLNENGKPIVTYAKADAKGKITHKQTNSIENHCKAVIESAQVLFTWNGNTYSFEEISKKIALPGLFLVIHYG